MITLTVLAALEGLGAFGPRASVIMDPSGFLVAIWLEGLLTSPDDVGPGTAAGYPSFRDLNPFEPHKVSLGVMYKYNVNKAVSVSPGVAG